MKYSQIVAYVRKIGHFDTEEEAENAICVVARAFAQRLSEKAASKMASQLPGEIASTMTAVSGHGEFGLLDFFNRIAQNLAIGQAEAFHHAEVVLSVLQDALPTEILERVFAGLDPEFRNFLNASAVLDKREGFSLTKAAVRLSGK